MQYTIATYSHCRTSTHQLVSAANAQTYALSVTYGDWGKIQEYGLQQTDLASNTTTSQTRYYSYGSLNEGQTTFAPNSISYADGTNVNEQYGIGGSLQRRETNIPGNQPNEELYRFGADGNLRLYSYDRLFYSLYGYDGGTTRTYKYSFDLNPNWVNGRLEAVNFNLHNAMFYPNAYINFNNDGYYTKHYYNGMERIASRLGDQNLSISTHNPELQDRKDWQDSLIRKNVTEITGYEFLPLGQEQNPDDPKPVFELPVIGISNLLPSADGIFYYHPNHLGSTCYVTDENASVVQGFLYAPFGEITNEYNNSFGSSVLPKYSFNAKELDEETGMYYYEARYYQPPTFTSRDPLFEKYPTFSPYAYCANNPIKYVDPSGEEICAYDEFSKNKIMDYLKEHFENTNIFYFEGDYLQINKKVYREFYKKATQDQKILLSGMKKAIERKETAFVKVQENKNSFYYIHSWLSYDKKVSLNNNGFSLTTNSGAAAPVPIEGTLLYAVAINDHGDGKGSQLTTDYYDEHGNSLKTTAVASTTFFHEVLDEFLNTIIKKKITPKSSKRKKVYYQNAALRNLGALERNGDDHE